MEPGSGNNASAQICLRRLMSRIASTEGLKLGVICVLIAVAWIFFAIPTIVYHLPQEDAASDSGSERFPNSTFNCSQGFSINSNDSCSPVCGEWKEISQSVVVALDTVVTMFFLIHLIGSIVALVLSCYRYKFMFRFPSILLVYYLAIPTLFDMAYLIGFVWRDSLYCASSDLIYTIENPTGYCSFTGVVTLFTFSATDYILLAHTITVFWKVWFPVHAKQFEHTRYFKFFHLGIIMAVLVMPWISISVAFGTGGFALTSFPPFTTCFAKEPAATFYPFILPKCIFYATEITLILLTIWKLFKVNKVHAGKVKYCCTGLSCETYTAEAKLMGVFLYLLIGFSISLTLYTITSRRVTKYMSGFTNYFTCEASGHDPENPCEFELDRRDDMAMNALSIALAALAPYAAMVYIVNVGGVKAWWGSWREKNINAKPTEKTVTSVV